MLQRASDGPYYEALSTCGAVEPGVKGAELDRASSVLKLQNRGELHGVVTSQRVPLGKLAGQVDERVGKPDDVVGGPVSIELTDRPTQVCSGEFAFALVSRKGGSCFRIGDERGGYGFRLVDSAPHFG
jgi:hypothetical protein